MEESEIVFSDSEVGTKQSIFNNCH